MSTLFTSLILMLSIGVSPSTFAAILAEPLVVDQARLDAVFAAPPTPRRTRDALRDLNFQTDGRGLLFVPLATDAAGRVPAPTEKDHELVSARRIGAALFEHFGYTLALVSAIDRIDVPAFDGVVLDEDRRVVANFSLKSKRSLVNLVGDHDLARAKALSFARLGHWPSHLRREARSLVGLHGRAKKGDEVVIKAPGRQNAYLRREVAARKMVDVFGVGTGRPTWILFDLSAATPIADAEAEELRAAVATAHAEPDARTYVYQTHALFDVRATATVTHDAGPSCNDLMLAAE